MRNKGPIALRKKKLKNGGYSLYLDYYMNGVRKYETLHIYLNPEKNAAVKAANKNAYAAAETILSKRIIEFQSGSAGIVSPLQRHITMLDFGDSVLKDCQKRASPSYCKTITSALGLFIEYAGKEVKVVDITPELMKGFAEFLKNYDSARARNRAYHYQYNLILTKETINQIAKAAKTTSVKELAKQFHVTPTTIVKAKKRSIETKRTAFLSTNTICVYFSTIKILLNEAVRQGIIAVNPIARLKASETPKRIETQRAHLSIEELRLLADTPCKSDNDKRMFLFSCFTGLRWSDVCRVTWRMISEGKIEIVMKKTERLVVVPISENAKKWLPERNGASLDACVYEKKNPKMVNDNIHEWIKNAGINKNVSFHVARHTFATLALTYGADLYTVSKLLGHQSIAITQIYAKIVDKKKEEAVNLIPDL